MFFNVEILLKILLESFSFFIEKYLILIYFWNAKILSKFEIPTPHCNYQIYQTIPSKAS